MKTVNKCFLMLLGVYGIIGALSFFSYVDAFSEDVCYYYKNPGIVREQDSIIPISFNCFDLNCTEKLDQKEHEVICAAKGLKNFDPKFYWARILLSLKYLKDLILPRDQD